MEWLHRFNSDNVVEPSIQGSKDLGSYSVILNRLCIFEGFQISDFSW